MFNNSNVMSIIPFQRKGDDINSFIAIYFFRDFIGIVKCFAFQRFTGCMLQG